MGSPRSILTESKAHAGLLPVGPSTYQASFVRPRRTITISVSEFALYRRIPRPERMPGVALKNVPVQSCSG
ncbi:hypothetical protein M2432_005471 [Mycobacterium sp. OTB74]|nr:hypothetical protein [Mycobacterium sp. OTB74]